jgi:3-hydroxyisobutyrate dehydrogenase-like beta-hydroxyacid dehydrogenase
MRGYITNYANNVTNDTNGPKFENADFSVEIPLPWMHKDLHLVAETANETGAALPASNVTKEG